MKVSYILIISLMTIAASATENPNVFKYKVGSIEVITLSEGQGAGRSDIFVGATAEMIQECLPDGTYPNSCNAFLVRVAGKNVLIDAGRRSAPLLENLKSVGIAPEQVDVVLITHSHGDHIGGLLADGQAVFANARLYLSRQEHDFARENAGMSNVLEAYKSKLELFEPKEIDAKPEELFAGIRAVAAFGHTPGHTMFLIQSGKEKLLIWGDLTHAMAIQMPYPQVAMTYDKDPEMAIAARKKVLQYVAKNKIAIAGMHNAFPGIGKITKAANGYQMKSVE